MKQTKLDAYEDELLTEYESGNNNYISLLTSDRAEEVKLVAENTFKKNRRINIRISNRDLVAIQKRALEEGMPYQTLVSSILHKYVSGTMR